MTTPDLDMIKDIPGYKVIMKAILKSQIQQLVEQLANHTEEESVILTASLSDGTLSHLGSDSGKSFLKDHEDVKSQFLGFCLKKHHRKKQEEALLTTPPSPQQSYSPRPQIQASRSTRQNTPSSAASRGRGARHEPYPVSRIRVARSSTTAPSSTATLSSSTPSSTQSRDGIKVEPADDSSNHSDLENSSSNVTSAPHDSYTSQSYDHDSESGGLDPADDASRDASDSGEVSQDVKLEGVSELDMDLEMTGVEPGASSGAGEFSESWGQEALGTPGQDSSGAMGSMTEMQQYTPVTAEQQRYDWPIVVIKTEPIEYDTELPSTDVTPEGSDQDSQPEPLNEGLRMRFRTVDEVAIQSLPRPTPPAPAPPPQYINPSTAKRNRWAVNLYEKWRQFFILNDNQAGEHALVKAILKNSSLLSMTTEELNEVLPVFFMSVKKSNGEEYRNDSLQQIALGLQRYFKSYDRQLDLFTDPSFVKTRSAIESTMQEKCSHEKIPRGSRILPIDKDQESYLWWKGFLGTKSALALVETMFWMVTVYFGLRSGEEHRSLTFDNFSVVFDKSNKRYLGFTKTPEEDGTEIESFRVREDLATPTQCPLKIFLLYQSRIPEHLRKFGFYFKPAAIIPEIDSPWFTNAPLGQKTLGNLIKKLMLRAGFKGSYSNHSPRYRGRHGNKEETMEAKS